MKLIWMIPQKSVFLQQVKNLPYPLNYWLEFDSLKISRPNFYTEEG